MDARLESKVDEHDRMLIEMQTILKGIALWYTIIFLICYN